MVLSRERFAGELSDGIRAGRSFGVHPLWRRIEAGLLPRSELRTFANQFFLQVFELPRAVSALRSRCADADHSDVGDPIFVEHAQSEETEIGVGRAVETSLVTWGQIFDGIERKMKGAHDRR